MCIHSATAGPTLHILSRLADKVVHHRSRVSVEERHAVRQLRREEQMNKTSARGLLHSLPRMYLILDDEFWCGGVLGVLHLHAVQASAVVREIILDGGVDHLQKRIS